MHNNRYPWILKQLHPNHVTSKTIWNYYEGINWIWLTKLYFECQTIKKLYKLHGGHTYESQ